MEQTAVGGLDVDGKIILKSTDINRIERCGWTHLAGWGKVAGCCEHGR